MDNLSDGAFQLDFLTEYTDEALLSELRRVAAELEHLPLTQASFNKMSGRVHWYTLHRRFGSWKGALAKAGLEHCCSLSLIAKQSTDSQRFENLAEVWTHYGRAPLYREMSIPPSKLKGKNLSDTVGDVAKSAQGLR